MFKRYLTLALCLAFCGCATTAVLHTSGNPKYKGPKQYTDLTLNAKVVAEQRTKLQYKGQGVALSLLKPDGKVREYYVSHKYKNGPALAWCNYRNGWANIELVTNPQGGPNKDETATMIHEWCHALYDSNNMWPRDWNRQHKEMQRVGVRNVDTNGFIHTCNFGDINAN